MKDFVPAARTVPDGDDAHRTALHRPRQAGDLVAALVAYVKTLDPPHDRVRRGHAVGPTALRGEKLFQGKGGCIECHGGPLFTDNLVHNTGVPQVDVQEPLPGPGTPT